MVLAVDLLSPVDCKATLLMSPRFWVGFMVLQRALPSGGCCWHEGLYCLKQSLGGFYGSKNTRNQAKKIAQDESQTLLVKVGILKLCNKIRDKVTACLFTGS